MAANPSSSEPAWVYFLEAVHVGGICLASSIITSALLLQTLASGNMRELAAISAWTIPFTLAVSASSPVFIILLKRLFLPLRYLLAFVIGAALGVFWQICTYSIFLNPLFGTFSIPLSLAWGVGGACALIGLAGHGLNKVFLRWTIEIMAIFLLCTGAGYGVTDIRNWIFPTRSIYTIWIRYTPGENDLLIKEQAKAHLTQKEIDRLMGMKLKGNLDFEGVDNRGEGPISRIVVVLQKPVEQAVELRLPVNTVMYFQQDDGSWQTEPDGFQTSSGYLQVLPNPAYPNRTSGLYVYSSGGSSFLGGIQWDKKPLP